MSVPLPLAPAGRGLLPRDHPARKTEAMVRGASVRVTAGDPIAGPG
ncbi:hypothetical protein [Streptomyces caelestis]